MAFGKQKSAYQTKQRFFFKDFSFDKTKQKLENPICIIQFGRLTTIAH